MLISSLVKSASSFSLFAELFLVIFFVDCSIFSVGICENLKLTTGSLYYPNFQIYRFLTFFLVNTNVLLFVFDAAGFLVFDLLLQRRWNFVEKMKFLLITTWFPGLMCLIYYYIKFACSRTEADLFFTGVHGSSSFVAAVTVVSRQLMHDVSSNAKLQPLYRHGSLFYLVLIASLQLFNAIPSITFLYSFFGLLYGWTYLRFFQKHTDGKRGDFRNSFSFVSLFPRFFQPIIAIPVNFFYALFVAFKLCPKIEQQYEILSASSFSRDVPTVSYSDNERYKRMALQDLNARLGKKQEPLEEWPTLFDEEGGGSRPPNPAAAPPYAPLTAPDRMGTKAVQQSTDSISKV
ncbi:transmembrane protein 115 [Echinococcus multilocularis]|uniref:Transmembrane protein 115 n=1 Tax=Echinococcus multilocularis TaxID=6211 RepID=A0A068Y8J9_ECHMU|nr:transmembrane protein 115 [Echinococcus multilocularis]